MQPARQKGFLGSLPEDLLVSDSLPRSLTSTSVTARPLTVNRKTTTVSQPSVAGDVLDSVDVLKDLTPQRTLDGVVLVDVRGELSDLFIRKIFGAHIRLHLQIFNDLGSGHMTDTIEIGKGNNDALVVRNINTKNTWHNSVPLLALTLLVAWVGFADHTHDSTSTHDATALTDLSNARSDLHDKLTW